MTDISRHVVLQQSKVSRCQHIIFFNGNNFHILLQSNLLLHYVKVISEKIQAVVCIFKTCYCIIYLLLGWNNLYRQYCTSGTAGVVWWSGGDVLSYIHRKNRGYYKIHTILESSGWVLYFWNYSILILFIEKLPTNNNTKFINLLPVHFYWHPCEVIEVLFHLVSLHHSLASLQHSLVVETC